LDGQSSKERSRWQSALESINVATSFQEICLVQPDDLAKPATQTNAGPREDAGASADLRLVEGCRSGHLAAFEELYRLHGPRMKSIAMNMLGSTGDAEDVVQEVFLKVYRGIGSFRGQSAFSTWVYRILVNACRDFQRRGFRRYETSQEELAPEARDVPVPSADHALRMTLETHVARLPAHQREVFVLFDVEGFRHSEVADMLNISEASSKNILFEARQSLRRALLRTEKRA
jgi:RNA polymerase sigma-70 factor, ECF subfamily